MSQPPDPEDFTATPRSGGVDLAWTQVAGLTYEVTITAGADAGRAETGITGGAKALTLGPGDYSFELVAVSDDAPPLKSDAATASATVPPADESTALSAPKDVSITASVDQLVLKWSPVASAARYLVRGPDGFDDVQVPQSDAEITLALTVDGDGLRPGVVYQFQVVAVDAADGESEPSPKTEPPIALIPPSPAAVDEEGAATADGKLHVITGPKGFKVTWGAVAGATAYVLTVKAASNAAVLQTRNLGSGDTTATITGQPDFEYIFEVAASNGVATGAALASNPVKVLAARPSHWWQRASRVLIGVGAGLAGISAMFGLWAPDHNNVWWSAAIGTFGLTLSLLLLYATNSQYRVFGWVVGFDGRVGTSKIQAALWTLLIAWILFCFIGLTFIDGRTNLFEGFKVIGKLDNGDIRTEQTDVWSDYLILLGGPFASLVAAKGIVSAKVKNGTLQKTVGTHGAADLRQALQNDSGSTDVVDSQYLIFNLVALVYVVVALGAQNQLPEIPPMILALTGTSAATYVVSKSVQRNAPTLNSISPSTAVVGETIALEGSNFMPSGTRALPNVTIGGLLATVVTPPVQTSSTPGGPDSQPKLLNADNLIKVVVPAELGADHYDVVLTTAGRVSTQPRRIRVVADVPSIKHVSPPQVPGSGGTVTISGTRFVGALSSTPDQTMVVVDGALPRSVGVRRSSTGLEQIDVAIPANPAARDVSVVVHSPYGTGGATATATVGQLAP